MKKIYFSSQEELEKKSFITKWIAELNDEIGGIYYDNKVFFYSSVCPHFGGDFRFCKKKKVLKCNWHGWMFSIFDGTSCTDFSQYEKKSLLNTLLKSKKKLNIGCFPFKGNLKRYNFVIDNSLIYIVYENSSI